VTVLDASNFWHYYESELDDAASDEPIALAPLLVDQLEFCTTIMLNKVDLAHPDDVDALESLARQLNPSAAILRATYAQIRRANWFRDHDPVLLSQAGAHIALDVLELAELPLAPSANGETEAEAFEGCFVNPITRYGEAETLTTELVFIGQQMPEADIRRRLDNCCR
jgi:G3E family GTPase